MNTRNAITVRMRAQPSDNLCTLSVMLGDALKRADETCDRNGRIATYADILIARDQILAERKLRN